MPRITLMALIAILLTSPARAAEPCGELLKAFSVYEVMEEEEVVAKHSLFPIPEDWSDASSFHGVVSESANLTLEVMVEGKKKSFVFAPWERDASLSVAKGFTPKKIFQTANSGSSFILRLKRDGKVICEERREIFGD